MPVAWLPLLPAFLLPLSSFSLAPLWMLAELDGVDATAVGALERLAGACGIGGKRYCESCC